MKSYQTIFFPNETSLTLLLQDKDMCEYADYMKDYYKGIVILDNNLPIGCVFVGEIIDKGFILNLFVKEKYRGKGIGRSLITSAVTLLKGIDLIVDVDNIVAINLYKSVGFHIVDTVNKGQQYYMKIK